MGNSGLLADHHLSRIASSVSPVVRSSTRGRGIPSRMLNVSCVVPGRFVYCTSRVNGNEVGVVYDHFRGAHCVREGRHVEADGIGI